LNSNLLFEYKYELGTKSTWGNRNENPSGFSIRHQIDEVKSANLLVVIKKGKGV